MKGGIPRNSCSCLAKVEEYKEKTIVSYIIQ